MLIAQFTQFSAEGHGFYRVHEPARQMSRQPGITVVDCDPDRPEADWLGAHADVLILHGINPDYPPLAAWRRTRGHVTLFEASDNYFDIQPWTNYSQGWLDRGRHDQFWHHVATVDAVQTSTAALAELWRPAARKVLVLGNHRGELPPLRRSGCNLTPQPPSLRGKGEPASWVSSPLPTGEGPGEGLLPLTVGWAGSATHLPDWFRIAPVVAGWVKRHPAARLAVMTDELARSFVSLPPDRYTFAPPGSYADYERFLAGLDVGVVPLVPSPFNRGRTDLKFAEFAAAGVAGIYAAEGPYPAAVRDGETGFLFASPAELLAKLDRLADAATRAHIRRAAYAEVERRTAADRAGAYRELLGHDGKNAPLPEELLASAERDGNYLALRPTSVRRSGNISGKPDRPTALAAAAEVAWSAGDLPAARRHLERAVAANPAYAHGWKLLVRAVESLEPAQALAFAERAARNQPHNYLAALAVLKFLDPPAREARYAECLDHFAPSAAPEEQSYLAAAFGRVAAEYDFAEGVLRKACGYFPQSMKLAYQLAACLYAAGDIDGAARAYARGLALVRLGEVCAMEQPTADERRLGAVAEYAHA